MDLVFYERIGHEGRRPSPFSWRVRYALAHKGLCAEVIPVRFADVETVIALSGQKFVPIILHEGRVVADSWAIAEYLEDGFANRPSLFGGERGRACAHFVSRWTDEILHPLIRALLLPEFLDCLHEADRPYYRESREAMLKVPLDSFADNRLAHGQRLTEALAPLQKLLEQQPFMSGDTPAFADYVVFAAFQWARLGSPEDILSGCGAIRVWRGAMIDLYDNLADRFPAYPK